MSLGSLRTGPGGRARPLRFLLLCLGGWTMLRTMMLWNPAVPAPPPGFAPPPWALPSPFDGPERRDMAVRFAARAPLPRAGAGAVSMADPARGAASAPAAGGAVGEGFAADRHALRYGLAARLLPAAAAGATPASAALWGRGDFAARADPGRGSPFWMRRSPGGWSLSGWLHVRQGSAQAPGPIAAGGQLGGSQAGLRLGYGLGDSGRLRLYARATMALAAPEQRDVAFGAAFAPLRTLPVDVAVEQRVAAGRDGRTALAAFASGGVGEVALPAGFRLEAYAQAGLVGARRRDGFAEGQVVVDRVLGPRDEGPFRIGALAAGAVQPGAARVDVGPRLSVRLPAAERGGVGKGGRVALDWRQRVAGDARPDSGVALTLAADF